MEPARSTGNFNRRITVADSNNIITVLDMNAANAKYQIFDQDYLVEFQAVIEDLKITVGLLSLLEAPWPDTNALMSESATMAEIAKIRTQGQKISLGLYVASGNGPWQYESEVVLQNQGGSETHVPILVPFLSSNETLLIAGNFKLGVKIEPKWNQPMKANDYLVIKGTWRQIVSFSKKKDDDVEMLSARIASLELAVNGKLINLPPNTLLGRGATIGIVESIDRSNFIKASLDNNTTVNLKRLKGNTSTAQGGITALPHQIDASKILGLILNVAYDNLEGIGPNYYDPSGPGYAYANWYDATNVNILLSPNNSAFILNKPVSVLIFYTS